MSLNRLTVAHRIIASSKNMTYRANVAPLTRFARWQSTGTPAGGLTTLKVLVYGVSTAGLMIGGSLVYANYNPSFRYKIDKYIPGFAGLADFAADKWVDIIDTIKPNSTEKVGLKKDLGSISAKPSETKKHTPSVESVVVSKEEKPRLKQSYSLEVSGEEGSTLKPTKEGVPEAMTVEEAPPILSSKESTEAATKDATGPANRESEQLPSQQVKEEREDEKVVIIDKAVSPIESDASVEFAASVEHIEPDASVEGAVASMKEEATKAAMEIQSEQIKGLQSAQSSDGHFQWLKDAAQAETLLQEVYDKYKDLDDKTYELRKVLIEAEKYRQDKYAQAMKSNVDDETIMQTIAGDIAKADETVLTAEKNIAEYQLETNEVGQKLASLLDRASGLGLKSRVEEIRSELSHLHARAMMGAVDYAEEKLSGNVMEEYQQEVEKVKDWINIEVGTALPQADSQQEAVILMLKKRVDKLLRKLEEAEKDYQSHLVDALLKQKEELERLAEKKVQLHLQVQEQDIWKEAQKKQSQAIREKEEELKEQLLIQTAAHTQHLSEALQAQAEQLGAKWASQTEAKLIQQETHYQNELVRAMARLRGIEAMVDTVANAGERTRQQQSLRTALDTLSGALEQADLSTDPNEHYSFMKEVTSLQEAARGDHFILAILDSIPREAVDSECGIQSEAGLQQRFKNVKQICKQVALVPATGGGLGTYALSYMHSLLTFDLWKHADSRKDPVDMDTSELLQVADVFLQQGNMEGAIRLLNRLQGEPKRVARDWLRDAQLHLETKQAVGLVQNYLASVSLSIIQ